MTDYEMRKIAKMQAGFLVQAMKEDDELLDLMFPPKCMSIEEAAEFLRIPVGSLYQKVSQIPHEKIGRRLVFTDRALIRWMKSRRGCSVREMGDNTIPLRKVM